VQLWSVFDGVPRPDLKNRVALCPLSVPANIGEETIVNQVYLFLLVLEQTFWNIPRSTIPILGFIIVLSLLYLLFGLSRIERDFMQPVFQREPEPKKEL
jgi:hypothetical protein